MNPILDWLGKHKISTHTIAAVFTGLVLYYNTNSDFHSLVAGVQSRIPKWGMTLIFGAFWLWSWYRNGQKSPGNGSGPGGITQIANTGPKPGASAYSMLRPRAAMSFLLPVLAGILVAMPVAGCRHNVNSNPQVVYAQTLLDASNSSKLLSDGLVAANDFAESIQASEPDYYVTLKAWIVKIAKANDTAIAAIRAAQGGDSAADWKGAIAGIVTAAGNQDLTVYGFKSPASQQKATEGLKLLRDAIAGISNAFGGA
ncbi:MAG TPA: hypothetical protein VKW06_10410 [Candidatus Angelobacter sp.]|nr:hypothetical protein [Candidatus Angelobacter sp.]